MSSPHPDPLAPLKCHNLCLGSRGCSLSEDGGMLAQCQGLSKEVTELSQEEKKLDELIQSCTLDLKLLTEDSENQRYPLCCWCRLAPTGLCPELTN